MRSDSKRSHRKPSEQGLTIARNCVGEYCTSLDMAGCSITLVKLDDEIDSLRRMHGEDIRLYRASPR